MRRCGCPWDPHTGMIVDPEPTCHLHGRPRDNEMRVWRTRAEESPDGLSLSVAEAERLIDAFWPRYKRRDRAEMRSALCEGSALLFGVPVTVTNETKEK